MNYNIQKPDFTGLFYDSFILFLTDRLRFFFNCTFKCENWNLISAHLSTTSSFLNYSGRCRNAINTLEKKNDSVLSLTILLQNLAKYEGTRDVYADDSKEAGWAKGVGESIAGKLLNFCIPGKIKTFEQLKKKGSLSITGIDGYYWWLWAGHTVKMLHEQVHINTKEDLIKLCKNKLTGVKGFQFGQNENMCRTLKLDAGKKNFAWCCRKDCRKYQKNHSENKNRFDVIIARSIRRKKKRLVILISFVLQQKQTKKKTAKQFHNFH